MAGHFYHFIPDQKKLLRRAARGAYTLASTEVFQVNRRAPALRIAPVGRTRNAHIFMQAT